MRQETIANIDNYRIGPVNPTQKPAKGVRVHFTNQDDQILVSWVRQHAHNHSGNKIYQDLEEQVGFSCFLYNRGLLTFTSIHITRGNRGGIDG